MRRQLIQVALILLAAGALPLARAEAPSKAVLERGRYMVLVGHCNNCHTAGYMQTAGNVPEERWLLGNPVGWRGKLGTTYASNLRLYFAALSEADWLKVARAMRPRPPMPWWSVRDTSDDDLRALYHYIRSLAPLGEPAPAFLPPDNVPPRPFNQLPDLSRSQAPFVGAS
jgi:mono/diheme cytochrome c family protein